MKIRLSASIFVVVLLAGLASCGGRSVPQVPGNAMGQRAFAARGYASGNFVSFDPPGSLQTDAYAENDAGQIAGFYVKNSCYCRTVAFIRDANGKS